MEKYKHIHKRHNVSLLLYHLVCVAKYRRSIFNETVDTLIVEVCKELELKYELSFHEIGSDQNHIHFLIQTIPSYSPQYIVQIVKSILAKEIFKQLPEIKKRLRGGQFRTDGYYINTVGGFGTIDMIEKYIRNQGNHTNTYQQMYKRQKTQNLFGERGYA